MHELSEIVRAVDESACELVLATVVDVVGSSYRRPTARMLIYPDGRHIGTISGGCLERDLCNAAFDLTQNGPKLVSFDTRNETTDFNPRYNLGCSGIIYVLVEPITHDKHCPIRLVRSVLDSRQAMVAATVYQSSADEVATIGDRFGEPMAIVEQRNDELESVWAQVRSDGRPTCCELNFKEGEVRLLIEKISPPKPLWIFGAGDDAMPLAAMAKQLGWDLTVIDHRASLLTPERFPHARFICKPWHEAHHALSPTDETAAVLVTHSFEADTRLLPNLLNSCVGYVGVLGPKSRTGKVMRELHKAGSLPNPESLDRLHTPVGLDLGASAPAEIAVAILGEIIALGNERQGGLLKSRQAPIHEPVRHVLIDLTAKAWNSPSEL